MLPPLWRRIARPASLPAHVVRQVSPARAVRELAVEAGRFWRCRRIAASDANRLRGRDRPRS
jgi:hypothetical protein